MIPAKPALLTTQGIKKLGQLIADARQSQGLDLRGLAAKIQAETGEYIAFSAIRDLEKGFREPNWNTLAKIAAIGIVKDKKGTPYTTGQLFEIASEVIEP